MGAEILSIILKLVLSGKSVNELIGGVKDAVIDGISKTGMESLKNFADSRRNELNEVLSKENMENLHISGDDVYYVIEEVENLLSCIGIDNETFKNCQYSVEKLEVFLWDGYCRIKNNASIDMENDVRKGINAVAATLMKIFSESEKFTEILLKEIYVGVDTANRKLDDTNQMIKIVSDKIDKNTQKICETVSQSHEVQYNTCIEIEKNSINRAPEYAKIWDENMFLNNFDKRDKNAGTNVKLSEVYLEEHLPNYSWMNNDELEPRSDLKELLLEHIKDKVENKMLLVLGQPGIGKSTLITWIMANFKAQEDNILIYKFSSELNDIDWNESDFFVSILEKLELSYGELNDKTLILDGFDEINAGDNRREVLDSLYWNLIRGNRLERFSLIVTCRENYIQTYERIQCSYIRLQPWNESQIESFCEIYGKKAKKDISKGMIENIIKNKTILGIPLILYMVLALDISIENNHSMVDVYDKVFALEGGLYDRCIDYKEFGELHRIEKIKKQIHQISKEIAVWIFENNHNGEIIPKIEYEKICDIFTYNQEQEYISIKQDFLIGTYFAKFRHCEKTENDGIYFIHRSIYEYFVAETIYCSIKNVLASSFDREQEIFITNILKYIKTRRISNDIGEFLKYKILKLYNNMEPSKKENFWEWLETIVGKMMDKGMLCYIEKNMKKFDYIIKHEAICFYNIMFLLSMLSEVYPPEKYLLSTVRSELKQSYMMFLRETSPINAIPIIMKRTDFKGSNLKYAFLKFGNFCKSDFAGVNLEYADLEYANLNGANLNHTYLINTKLKNASLENAYLEDSVWSEEDILAISPSLTETTFEHIKIRMSSTKEIVRMTREEFFSSELFQSGSFPKMGRDFVLVGVDIL